MRQLGRISEIAQVAAKHGFGYLFVTRGPGAVRSRRGREVELSEEGSPRGQRLREMLDELGPTFVKFGQLLSTRPDVVPPDIVAELRSRGAYPREEERTVTLRDGRSVLVRPARTGDAAILGERPLECGVVPGFRPVDDAESELLFAQAWEAWTSPPEWE